MGATIYFAAVGPDGKSDLFVSDGTTAGTVQVNTPDMAPSGLAPSSFAALNGRPFFAGHDAAGRSALFTVDPATNTAMEVATPSGAATGLAPSELIAFNGKLYFQGTDATGQTGLFASDGTGAGTVRIGSSAITHLTRDGNMLAFAAPSAYGITPYLSDGTSGRRQLDLARSPFDRFDTSGIGVAGGLLVFSISNNNGRVSLQTFNGLSVSALAVPGLSGTGPYPPNPLGQGNPLGGAAGLLSFGAKAAFTALDTQGKVGVWTTDGTAAGTTELPGVTGTIAGIPMAALPNQRLAFIAADTAGQQNVFVTDGTTVTKLLPPGAAPAGLAPNGLMVLGSLLIFDGLAANGTRSLFRSDGTSAGTTLLDSGVALIAGGVNEDAAIIGPAPTLAITPSPRVLAKGAVVIAATTPGTPGDGLIATLLSDAKYTTGTLAIDAQGQLTYTASAFGNADIDTLAFRVTDIVTGQTVDGAATVRFAIPGPIVSTRSSSIATILSPAVIASAVPGTLGDTLTVSLVSDTTFPTGSAVAINSSNQVIYTPGPITRTNAATDTVTIRVTDPTTGETATASVQVLLQTPPPILGFADSTSGTSGTVTMDPAGIGGPGYLQSQYIYLGSDSIAFSTQADSVFIHAGSGNDAIQVASGQNVLDGGLGSNFETGGTGTDTFFTDARASGVVWNTVQNFHAGDAATLWGFTPGISAYRWDGVAGAPGAEGATLRANIVGGNGRIGTGVDASITFTGLSVQQAQALQIVTGTVSGSDYLYVYNPGV